MRFENNKIFYNSLSIEELKNTIINEETDLDDYYDELDTLETTIEETIEIINYLKEVLNEKSSSNK